MAAGSYRTLSESSLAAAADAEQHFADLGYVIRREPNELGFPFTPAFVAVRKPTRVVVEVVSEIDADRVDEWKCYCNACETDTQLMFVTTKAVSENTMALLAKRKIGLISFANNTRIHLLDASDIAFQITVPVLAGLSKPLRVELGPAYENFDKGNWREGFEDACIALENRVRPYLWAAIQSTRLTIYSKKGKPANPTRASVFKMTLGQLAHTLRNAAPVNHLDSFIADLITKINSERIKVAHKKYKAEKTLRQKVPLHTVSIISCMKKFS